MKKEQLKQEIRTLIENSEGRRWSRADLVLFFGISDRRIRAAISELRHEDKAHIMSDTKKGGYWLATDEEWRTYRVKEWRAAVRRMLPRDLKNPRQLVMTYAS